MKTQSFLFYQTERLKLTYIIRQQITLHKPDEKRLKFGMQRFYCAL